MKGKNNKRKTLRFKESGGAASIVCKRGNEAIDKSVCEVYQIRNPEQCFGCLYFRN